MSSSKTPVKLGVVGLSVGGWASIVLGPLLTQETLLKSDYDLVAISTSSIPSAEAAAKAYGGLVGHDIKAYADPAAIAADPNVDLVAITVKAPLHKSLVLAVIKAKKSFFLEWPAGVSLQETLDIAEAAKKAGVRSFVGLQGRHSRAVVKVKELIKSGKIGTIRSATGVATLPRETQFWAPTMKEDQAYLLEDKNGATLLNAFTGHSLDNFTQMVGEFSTINASSAIAYPIATLIDKAGNTTKEVPSSHPDHLAITGVLKSGAVVSLQWRTGLKFTPGRRNLSWEIDGEEGTIRIESNHPAGAVTSMMDPDVYLNGEKVSLFAEGEDESAGGVVYNVTAMWKEFAKGDGGAYTSIEDAIQHRRLLDAIQRSWVEGKTISL